jgi:hypothetical protein
MNNVQNCGIVKIDFEYLYSGNVWDNSLLFMSVLYWTFSIA